MVHIWGSNASDDPETGLSEAEFFRQGHLVSWERIHHGKRKRIANAVVSAIGQGIGSSETT